MAKSHVTTFCMFLIAIFATLISAQAQTFQVTLSNLTTGQPFSPYVFVTHDSTESVWEFSGFASPGIRQIAEEGDTGPLVADLTPQIGASVGSLITGNGPLLPGDTAMFLLQTDAAHPLLSSAWMLGVTNDGFSGTSAFDLSTLVGSVTLDLPGYDAGTEVNNESALFVPALGGILNDPEQGVISLHPGILGIGDITLNHIFANPVARLTITAVPEPQAWGWGMAALTCLSLLFLRRRYV